MPIKLGKQTAAFSGAIRIEEVDGLVAWLRETPKPSVNLRRCTHLHTAILQCLLVAGVTVSAQPEDQFLHSWALPVLEAHHRPAAPTAKPTPPTERASS
jgi:hypothetical protein